MVILEKGREKNKEKQWRWDGEVIERVREFTYLGFKFQRTRDVKEHIKERKRKANVLIREVWGIGERLFKDDFRTRIFSV